MGWYYIKREIIGWDGMGWDEMRVDWITLCDENKWDEGRLHLTRDMIALNERLDEMKLNEMRQDRVQKI